MKKNLWIMALVLLVGLILLVLLTMGEQPETQVQDNTVINSTIVISEICANNETIIADNDGKYRDYIELYNSGEPVSLKDYTFYDGKTKSQPLGEIVLDTGEYRIFYISRSVTGFALNASGGDTIQLLDDVGRVVAQTNTALLNTDEVMHYLNGSYRKSYDATPGFSNDSVGRTLFLRGNEVQQLPLVISEVLLRNVSTLPDENGVYSDLVELCNLSDEPVALDRYFLSDDLQERFAYRLPPYTLLPGEFVVIHCDGENYVSTDGVIHANFAISLKETLVLTSHNGDYTMLPAEYAGEDVSVFRDENGRYITGTPSVGYENSEAGAVALARSRIDEDAALIISEVLLSAAGVPYQGEFCDAIEITNVSDESVSTIGWFLSDGGDPYQYPLPQLSLEPGENIVIPCGVQNTGFSIADGEILRLTGPDYRCAPLVVCVAEYGKSISLLGNGEDTSYGYMELTLGYPNEKQFYGKFAEDQLTDDLRISEVMSGNGSYLKGPYGTTCDWIELYNSSTKTIQLSDYFLSDNKRNPEKYRLPELLLSPGEFCVIFLSDHPVNLLKEYPLISMPLAAEGESIYLSSEGKIVDYVLLPSVPYDMSYGRQPGDPLFALLQQPTPGMENSRTVEISASPLAATAQGCYDGVQYIDVVLLGIGDIYYTTDCTDPAENAVRYTGPIRLTQTTVLRVVCREKGKLQSESLDLTYLINENDHLPVVSLVTNPDNLWSDESGILVLGSNASDVEPYYGANYWEDWEKPASISLFETDGTGFSVNCGVKVYGNYSRMQNKKSLSCFFRPEYGASVLEYPLFGEDGLDAYESFVLRCSGQDAGRARMRDVLATSLMGDHTDVPVQDYKPVVLYLNGEYWGLYYIREKISEHYLGGHYNTDPDNMKVVFSSGEDKRSYWDLMHYVKVNDMRVQEHYDYVCSRMDIDEYIDFIIAQMWVANIDMPGNVKFFLNTEGQWTWILFDVDMGFLDFTNDRLEYILVGPDEPQDEYEERTFAVELLANPTFREKFLTRMAWQMNIIWSEQNVLARVDEIVAQIEPDMMKELERWNGSYEAWQQYVEQIRIFARNRNDHMLRHIQAHFQLTDEQMRNYGFQV